MRKMNQIIFLEAKSGTGANAHGKKCLKDKLDKLVINYNSDDIKKEEQNVYLNYSV